MTQQINLYDAGLRPQRTLLSALMLGNLLAVVVVGMLAVYGYQWWQTEPVRQRAATATADLASADSHIQRLREQYPPKKASPRLVNQSKSLRDRLTRTQRIATKLRTGGYGSIDGLSPFLEGLARQHVAGTWLTRVQVRNGGRVIGLEGKSLLPELVPAYIDRLSEEKVLARTSFSKLEMSVVPDSVDEIAFKVQTGGIKND